jgi:hypothetical protein
MIYLYLKIHNVTGLKYLGKTKCKDPHNYQGSGKYWKRHIKKHGYDVTTEILFQSNDPNEIKEKGLYYSDLYDVVNSNDFANLKEETGNGGWEYCNSSLSVLESRRTRMLESNPFFGKKHTEETKIKIREKRKLQVIGKHKEETKEKIKKSLIGHEVSNITRKKISEKLIGKERPHSKKRANAVVCCPYCGKEGKKIIMYRWHFDNCKENLT